MPFVRVLFVVAIVLSVAFRVGSVALVTEENYGIGSPDALLDKYLSYRAEQLKVGNTALLKIRLGYVKGLSRSFTAIAGELAVDLDSGSFQARVSRLSSGASYSLWLVDRKESDGISLIGDDTEVKVADILATASSASVAGELGLKLPLGFAIDRVVLARGTVSSTDVLAAGSTNVFQKIFFRRLSITNEARGTLAFEEALTAAPAFSWLVPDLVAEIDAARLTATSPIGLSADTAAETLFFQPFEMTADAPTAGSGGSSSVPLDVLISQGATFFLEGTFGGNGRTCGTCHPARNNFTIDVPFINSLPPNDPLFVAEFNPALAQLERPQLMRSFGLILENVDGLEDPTNRFVMRGVPHTLGLQVSLQADLSQPNPPAEMTGWSGDGAPGTGSLREFAIGAVTQHFTKTLARRQGHDFRLPSEHALDAMEAFQLSLGRSRDFNLSTTTFNDANVDNGRSIFLNGTGDPNAGGRCSACHGNGGALAANGQNRNFNTNVEDVPHPARSIEDFPRDGGFGRTLNTNGTFGNLAFNTASAVEAADTAPFFHNNVVSTLEGVVGFYAGPEFNNPRAPAARFSFTAAQAENLADFMRVLNAADNINIARRELEEILARAGNPEREVQTRLTTAFDDTGDAINVLNEGNVFPSAVTQLSAAQQLIAQAQQTSDPAERRTRIQEAVAQLAGARNTIGTFGS